MSRHINLLGYFAGTVIAVSALPQIIELMHSPHAAEAQSLLRNAMLVGGNIMWVAYGFVTHARPLIAMCAFGAFLNGWVFSLALAAQIASPHIAGGNLN